jgi:hypothetical protein
LRDPKEGPKFITKNIFEGMNFKFNFDPNIWARLPCEAVFPVVSPFFTNWDFFAKYINDFDTNGRTYRWLTSWLAGRVTRLGEFSPFWTVFLKIKK